METATREVIDIPIVDLILEGNARKTVTLDKTFLSTIRADGVLDPIKVNPLEDGKYSVVDGQRRVLASVDAGHPTVPALVETAEKTEVDRLARQLIRNDQREPINDADHTAVFQEMSLFGASADQIARKTRTPRSRIDTALAVAASPVASKAIAEHQMTIDEAAVFVEFEDSIDAIDALTETITKKPADFAHEAARIRAHRAEQASIDAKVAELEAAGVNVLATRPEWNSPYKGIYEFYSDEKFKNQAKPEDVAAGQLFASVHLAWGPDSTKIANVSYYVKDAKKAGVFKRTQETSNAGPLDDAEKERRKVTRDNNKLWVPATVVRLDWVKELLSRKDLPKGWELHAALGVTRGYFNGYDSKQTSIAAQVLGEGIKGESLAKYSLEHPDRAGHVLIALAVGRVEGGYEYFKKGWNSSDSVEHLKQLSAWGYTLSDIEQAVVAGTAKNGLS